MAYALRFLASPGARCLSGQALSVDGGTSIYGGSRRHAPATLATLPPSLPLSLAVRSTTGDSSWAFLGSTADTDVSARPNSGAAESAVNLSLATRAYFAVLDPSPMSSPTGGLVGAVHAAAVRFAAEHHERASLTLLVPHERAGDWRNAGDAAAARMLVATLACEWGGRQLRINAVEVPASSTVASIEPFLHFLASAQAQYITGQTIELN
jgi:hypothetical protein